MLLREKIKEISFSPSENEVIQFLLSDSPALGEMTIQEIAERCYVHPSTLKIKKWNKKNSQASVFVMLF
ncbi:hypothetical protein EfmJHP10_20380 [Enterococcus faecium]|nr:hypothetical protein EfmJHP10_20380 [Enterococcus faecium]